MGFLEEEKVEGGGGEPGGGEDVGAVLAFEEEGEPEWEGGAVGGLEGGGGALGFWGSVGLRFRFFYGWMGNGEVYG